MADQHLTEAEACLDQLGEHGDDSSTERSLLGRSCAHSLLSIARNLETVAARVAPPPADRDPLHSAAALLEGWAIGDEGEQRERTIARLVLHATGERYADAPAIAQHALDGTVGEARYAVVQAIMALRIELPV